jgi:hypothetical protein
MVKRLLPFLLGLCVVLVFAPVALAGGSGFGLRSVEVSVTEKPDAEQEANHELGLPDLRAGSHPYALTTSFSLNESQEIDEGPPPHKFLPAAGGPRDVRFELPPGFVGNPNAVPKCGYSQFMIDKVCPDDTVIGYATSDVAVDTGYDSPVSGKYVDQEQYETDPVYNLEPPGGVAAEFAFFSEGTAPVFIDASVRTGGDYGITVTSRVTQAVVVQGARVTIWGVPAKASHNRARGKCLAQHESDREEAERGYVRNEEESVREEEEAKGVEHPLAPAECPVESPVQPFLTNPTSCEESRAATLSVDPWREPGVFASKTVTLPPLEDCEDLGFSPSLTVTPDGSAGSTPTGLNVEVRVPQESTTNPLGLGEADVKDTTVVLPAGVQLSPSASDGLQACSGDPADPPGTPGNEIGFTGFRELEPSTEQGVLTPQFTPRLPGTVTAEEAGETALLEPGKNFCPNASKIANVKIKTPLLEGEVAGAVYLAAPQNFTLAGAAEENPFKSLIAMYLVAEEPNTGVLVKLPGKVALCEQAGEVLEGVSCDAPGQIVSTFENTPELPFSDLKLEFYGTDRAPLATSALCGTYTTTSSFTPWSAPESGPAATPSSYFQITSGPATVSEPNGTPCPGATPPFSPTLQSGTTNINAGSFTPLTTTLSREDGQQNIQQVTLHYPPGLSGILSGVKLCGEAEANAGTCGPESLIGETIVSVGLGDDPFTVTGGKVYITGPYEGAPFGLSIVNPAKAGPFDLQEGRPVIVRAKIEVDPLTTALTVMTNTTAQGYAIPSMIEGIPLQIKHVNVNITRSGFTFNSTNCNPTQITGTVASAEGASSPVSIPFQVTNCAALGFAPKFNVSTSAKTSRTNGASLHVKLTYPTAPFGSQANISRVAVDLPKQLPSRLKTLQKACSAAQFEANPAGCPAASVVGHAKAVTPLLPVALEGPAYFVSHGGEAFPSLIIVLQGYGVTVDLVGTTFINKKDVTSTTFKTVPDAPVGSFELTLPEGPYSALTTEEKTSLCKSKLVMPTTFLAQNGAELHQNTKVTVTGCPKKKKTELARKTKTTKKTKKKR